MRHLTYPYLAPERTHTVATDRISNSVSFGNAEPFDDLEADVAEFVVWRGDETQYDRMDIEGLRRARLEIEDLLEAESDVLDVDQIEGKASCILFRALENSEAPAEALSDAGFWRYVSIVHLWNFCVARQPKAFEAVPEPHESHKQYIDGRVSHLCVPSRMYLRVSSLGGLGHAWDSEMAWSVVGGTDFWRSHVLRVLAGEHPSIVRAMVRRQSDQTTRLDTNPLRAFAKDLNRTLTNIVSAALDDDEADALVGELWTRQLGPSASEA